VDSLNHPDDKAFAYFLAISPNHADILKRIPRILESQNSLMQQLLPMYQEEHPFKAPCDIDRDKGLTRTRGRFYELPGDTGF
jgi:hypothetical protein